MKMVKSLILGSAAGLVAMSGAQAADLPVKAKAVEYVRICSLYGAGFFYIPGTDTCIKLGGYLRVETAFGTNSVYNGAYSTQAGAQNRLSNYYTARSRQDLTVDTRTATEYGVVRTFFDATFSWTSGSYGGNGTGAYRLLRVPKPVASVALATPLTAVSPAARSASTRRSSSSLGSRWVRRSPRSTLLGSTIRATTSTVSSAAAATSPRSTSSPTLLSSATACRARSRWKIRPPTIRAICSTQVQASCSNATFAGGSYGTNALAARALPTSSVR